MKTILFLRARLAILLIAALTPFYSYTQIIHLHSVSDMRDPLGSAGYTLDGYFMQSSRGKLLFPSNFGSSGIYPKSVMIMDGYTHKGDLMKLSSATDVDLFFFGAFNKNDMTNNPFTREEIDSFYNWSLRGGKLIIGASPVIQGYNPFVLNDRWGYFIRMQTPSFVIPTEIGKRTTIFNGPFGNVTSAGQGGSAQGHFSVVPPTAVVLATTLTGEPTMLFDCATRDIIISDIDVFTSLGGISTSLDIENNQDRIWANTIAFMDNLENELDPTLSQNGNTFSLDLKYDHYEWYYQLPPYKDMLIGSDADFTPPKSGTYLLKVKGPDKIGCYSEFSKTFVFDKPQEAVEESDPDVEIRPNPAVEGLLKLVYLLPNTNEYATDFKVTDMAGRLIYSSKEQIVKRKANTLIVDVSTWAAAIYNVEVTLAGHSFVRRFIKI
jgi:hypothetical protein